MSRQETSSRPPPGAGAGAVSRLQMDNTASPWNRFDVVNSALSSFTVRRRSTSPAAAGTFALSPLSSPSSSYHGDDLASPDAGDLTFQF